MFRALGGTVEGRGGSRVAVELHGQDAHFHRPHPEKETDKGAVKAIRDFLEQVGERP
ncbi:MAG TPA: type II toxin-antitoxin system HicA family toxin [Chloroflexota bacterium]|nr:type II toxin-antitoxin system HicA family toxin [Chloroflexota bacterium]